MIVSRNKGVLRASLDISSAFPSTELTFTSKEVFRGATPAITSTVHPPSNGHMFPLLIRFGEVLRRYSGGVRYCRPLLAPRRDVV